MSTESSLTTPLDRSKEVKWRPDISRKELSEEQTEQAMSDLFIDTFTKTYPKSESVYRDPPLGMQTFALISFIPAKGASPNEQGMYGMAKIRGTFNTETEAQARAEEIIRKYDSYNAIQTCYVGLPFPLTTSRDYAAEKSDVEMKKDIAVSMSNHVKEKRASEEKQIQEIRTQEEKLIEDCKKTKEDPVDEYTMLKVKKAQVTWTYLESLKKIESMKAIIIKARESILEMEKENPEFKEVYMEKYLKARESAGLDLKDPNRKEQSEDSFIKYLVEDVDLGF